MRRFAVGAALLLVLAGCGGDPKADPSPSTPTPKPSASPTPTAPALPEAAKANTKAGAIAFVKYYIDLVNHAQASGDVSALDSVGAPSCESCQSVRDSIANIYQAGGSISGGAWHPHFNSALHNRDGSWLVNGYITFDPGQVQKSSKGPTEADTGGSAGTHVTALFADGRWEVTKWSRDS